MKGISLLNLGFPVFGLARWFVAGALVAEVLARGWRLPWWLGAPVGVLALLLAMCQLPALSSEYAHDAAWLVAFVALMLAMADVPASGRNPLNWPWLRWLGERSYSLYALHIPLVLIAIWASVRWGLSGRPAALVVTALALPATLVMLFAAWRWVETVTRSHRSRRPGAVADSVSHH
ncbi:acyltransferase family protein [Geodermatophilus sp. SYSU D01036]